MQTTGGCRRGVEMSYNVLRGSGADRYDDGADVQSLARAQVGL